MLSSLSTIRPTRRFLLALAVAVLVAGVDLVMKGVVRDRMAVGERHEFVPGWAVLTHVQNTGAAYGLLTGHRWLLVLTAGVIMLAAPLLLRALPVGGRWSVLGPVLTGMIVGGAAGNLAERAARGYVTDFLNVPNIPPFQVFNLADAAISVAIVVMLVLSFLVSDASHPRATAADDPPAGAAVSDG